MPAASDEIERLEVRRRRVITRAMGMLGLATVAVLAWALVWRPMTVMRRVGLAGVLPEEGRQCSLAPQANVRTCQVNRPSMTPRTGEREAVWITRSTRQIPEAMREWQTEDSATWSHLRDSIALALDDWGGKRIPCPSPDPSHGTVHTLAAWRFDEQDVRLLTQRLHGADGRTPIWIAQVFRFPVGLSGCEPRIPVRRLLTTGELGEHLWRWLTESSD
jgi:hypothetical protein